MPTTTVHNAPAQRTRDMQPLELRWRRTPVAAQLFGEVAPIVERVQGYAAASAALGGKPHAESLYVYLAQKGGRHTKHNVAREADPALYDVEIERLPFAKAKAADLRKAAHIERMYGSAGDLSKTTHAELAADRAALRASFGKAKPKR